MGHAAMSAVSEQTVITTKIVPLTRVEALDDIRSFGAHMVLVRRGRVVLLKADI